VPGNNLTLTLDIRLQKRPSEPSAKTAERSSRSSPPRGSACLRIQAGLRPEPLHRWHRPGKLDALNNSPDKPLNNRALTGLYPPGSTFKPYMALAALELGTRTPSQTIFDPGYFVFGNNRFRDATAGGHGVVDMYKSIVVSCDTYYYMLANDLGIDNIARFIGQFGFGARTGIDIEGNSSACCLPRNGS